ncbi:MAG: hypothetical protein HC821_01065 [Lewinella sp.]|nr:hypothetical protein [Lewinella sp.]
MKIRIFLFCCLLCCGLSNLWAQALLHLDRPVLRLEFSQTESEFTYRISGLTPGHDYYLQLPDGQVAGYQIRLGTGWRSTEERSYSWQGRALSTEAEWTLRRTHWPLLRPAVRVVVADLTVVEQGVSPSSNFAQQMYGDSGDTQQQP